MRTNIDLDEALITEAMRITGLRTKKAVVEEALRRLVRAGRQTEAIHAMSGLGWGRSRRAARLVRPVIVIGTFCIRVGHALLHDDRDFMAMQQYLGLMVL